jgi:hypothetical protein
MHKYNGSGMGQDADDAAKKPLTGAQTFTQSLLDAMKATPATATAPATTQPRDKRYVAAAVQTTPTRPGLGANMPLVIGGIVVAGALLWFMSRNR